MLSRLTLYLQNIFGKPNTSDRELILIGQAAIRLRNTLNPIVHDLRDVELKVFSQWGEDGILDFICHKLNLRKPRMLEFGVGDFSECNSRFLVENRNASVVLVDSHPGLVSFVENQDCFWKSTVIPLNQWITRKNAQSLVSRAETELEGLDIFSIDLDGNDYWILNELNLDNVRIVILEYNPVFGPNLSISVPPNDDFNRSDEHWSNLYYGASLRAYINLMSVKGFQFLGTNVAGSNAFFVRNTEHQKLGIRIPDLQNLSEYCDWRVRESRNANGQLSLLTGDSRWELIKDLPFVVFD